MTAVDADKPLTAEEFINSIKDPEDLHPDLKPYLHVHATLGQILQHPLVYSIPHGEGLNAFANRMYQQKLRLIAEAEAENDIPRIVHMHEQPWRLDALVRHHRKITDHGAFWELVRNVWTSTEVIHTNYDLWERLWLHGRPQRRAVMDPEERETLDGMPDIVQVYRGGHHRPSLRQGFSWTLRQDEAVWFARRYQETRTREPHVAEAKIRREDILAVFHTSEHEVVVNPHALIDVKVRKIQQGSQRRPRSME